MEYNSVEKLGKTVDEAITFALKELNTNQKNVNIEIIDEGNKGIFGLIGNKMAKVRVTLKESRGENAKRFLRELLDNMGIYGRVEFQETEDTIFMDVDSEDVGIIIGRRGETLDSIQYLLNLVVNKNADEHKRIILDIKDYRKKRDEALITLADKVVERVIRYKKSITLEPMNAYERRVIHLYLQENDNIKTFSIGDEPFRKIVVSLR